MRIVRTLLSALALLATLATPALATPEPPIEGVRDLLLRLERADDNLSTLVAQIQYTRQMALQGDTHIRRGDLYFRSNANAPGAPRRRFAIDFTTLIIPPERMEDDRQRWVFDGEWLIERREAEKQFIKRRVAPPDAKFDPLRIGEGPMPIPIGQDADEILRRYDAELLPPADIFREGAQLAQFVQGSRQLRLVPKPAWADQDDFKEIRLWYRWDEDANRYLPRLSRTTARGGDQSYVQLINVRINAPIDPRVMDVAPPDERDGWAVQMIDNLDNEPQ